MGSLTKITTKKDPEMQNASPASQQSGRLTAIEIGTGQKKITEAWKMANPSQTKVPTKSNMQSAQSGGTLTPLADSWKSKTVPAAVGAGRGGRTVTNEVERPTLAGRAADLVSGSVKQWGSGLSLIHI